jgi:hypothetical protein
LDYLSALGLVHEIVRPSNYCEIGCRYGYSLALSRVPAIGIDPDFEIKTQLIAPTQLYRMTSDDFFGGMDVRKNFGAPIDFAFIDGMHLAEFALRDFINFESASHEGGLIAVDDLLPGDLAYASRERKTQIWTGDVYRIIPLLRHHRPDLEIRVYDVAMKGFGTITHLDPSSSVLRQRLKEIEAELNAGRWMLPDVAEIRRVLDPRPVSELEPHLRAFAAARRPAATKAQDGTGRYLDLLKRSILNEIYLDDELRIHYLRDCLAGTEAFDYAVLHDIRDRYREEYEALKASRLIGRFYRKIANSGFSHSMIGRARMDSLHACLDIVRQENIPGDLIECGVWRGGSCIFMAGYLEAYGLTGHKVVVADSFEGLPVPTLQQDARLDLSKNVYPQLAVSQETVQENFSVYGLDTANVVYLKGWFKDTLPGAPVEQIALLRMDGDLYESTMNILDALYDKVVDGGIVIVDDYNAIKVCRGAVSDFFRARHLPEPYLQSIDWTGVWFRKMSR